MPASLLRSALAISLLLLLLLASHGVSCGRALEQVAAANAHSPFYQASLDHLMPAQGVAPSYTHLPLSVAPSVLRLHQHFSNNMVLQRGPKQATVWGQGVPGSQVSISLAGEKAASATVDGDGWWEAKLPVQPLTLNTSLSVTDGTTQLNLSNVAFGDVLLCSGQSNMVLTLNFTFGGPEMVARWASYPYVRLYNVPQYQSSNTPLNESQSLSYPGWATVNPTSLIAYPGDYSTYFSSVCFFTGAAVYDSLKGEVPIGLVQSSYGGTSAEAWTSADALGNCGPYNPGPNPPTYMLATVVYNAMMHPLLRVALTAVVWYQGESNGGALLPRYTCAFPNLIDNWRDKFHQPDLPWFFALLAPYASGGTGLPPLRIAQLSGLTRPRTWVANAIDLGDEQSARTDIHPRNKSYLGERLARHIRRELYGQEVVASGPNVSSVTATLSGSTVMVQLTYQPGPESDGLHAISTPNCTTINGGAMAGPCCTFADGGRSVTGLFYAQVDGQPANSAARPVAAIGSSRLTANVTFATAPRVGQQLMVRVAWSQYPGCVLYNNQLLPALPSIHNVTIGPGGPVDPVVTSSSTGDAAVVVSSSSAGGSDAVSSGSAATGEAVTSTGAPTPMTSSSTGDGDDDGSSSSMMLMLGAVVVVVVLLLVVMGALVWRRQQQRASEAGGAANGYTSMGDTDGTSRR